MIFVGDAAVGKSSLIRKISRGTFSSHRDPTASMCFSQLMSSAIYVSAAFHTIEIHTYRDTIAEDFIDRDVRMECPVRDLAYCLS